MNNRRQKQSLAVNTSVQLCHFPTALGEMAIAWEGSSLVRTFLPETSVKKLLASARLALNEPHLEWTVSPPAFVGHLAAQIRTHLRGQPQSFSLKALSLGQKTAFTRKVYACSQKIPSGAVLTYGELAKQAGSPGASRAVGQAMARNPFPILIPCHRVVGSSRSSGGFTAPGGLTTKAKLLKIEGNSFLG